MAESQASPEHAAHHETHNLMTKAAPNQATSAVLKRSDPVPDTAVGVRGIDFNAYRDHAPDIDELVACMATSGFQATAVADAVRIINTMITWRDPTDSDSRTTVFLGYTSNLVSSGLREVIRYLVEHRHVAAIVTTAGGVEEDLIKCLGSTYLGDFEAKGATLHEKGLNRIGNLYVPNDNYCKFEDWITPVFDRMFADQESRRKANAEHNTKLKNKWDFERDYQPPFSWSPSAMIRRLGEEMDDDRSICTWAARNDIPIFCPALTDGSIGDMLYFDSFKRAPHQLDLDIRQDIRRINDMGIRANRAGMIILGGGIVKHHIANACLMRNGADYAVYINTANEFDGSDAGARPDEAVSWGKIKAGDEAESVKVYAEATVVFPLIVAATFAKADREARKAKTGWT
ncbi:MAG: Deoxyhypusine synthase [Chrysothrix sp. TS-e1954]|nr:MAG: Deoxyhypusine synthase [Chrysothrix sp. TS-e1954]